MTTILSHPTVQKTMIRALIAYEALKIVGILVAEIVILGGSLYVSIFRNHFARVTEAPPEIANVAPIVGIILAIIVSVSLTDTLNSLEIVKPEPKNETAIQEAGRLTVRYLIRLAITSGAVAGLVTIALGLGGLAYVVFSHFVFKPGLSAMGVIWALGASAPVAGCAIWAFVELIKWARSPRFYV
ncbi:MAG: hypothetical protein ACREDP_22690 [Bradyrhizobium sp.]